MIAASEPQEFVPFGRQQMKRHPGAVILPTKQNIVISDIPLAEKFSKVRIQDCPQDEWWTLCDGSSSSGKENSTSGDPGGGNGRCEDDFRLPIEKELYVAGKTAVVSLGAVGHSVAQGRHDKSCSRLVEVSYTVETPIYQSLFCNFLDNNANPLPSLCLIETDKISVFMEKGQEFTTPLQFKVAGAWATKFGLLLERVAYYYPDKTSPESCNWEELTTLFTVLHPLDEISPILCVKQGGVLTYMNDAAFKVVFTSDEPSICLLYNIRSGLHSIWKIRWAMPEECEGMCGQPSIAMINTSAVSSTSLNGSNISVPGIGRPSGHLRLSMTGNRSLLGSQSSSKTPSPFGYLSSTKPCHPSPSSPFSINLSKHQCHSHSSTRISASHTSHSTISSASLEARLGCSMAAQLGEPKPIVPKVCLEYIWTEPNRRSLDDTSISKKTFLTTDFLGQEYLCYITSGYVLAMVKIGRTNTKSAEPIICTVNYLSAKDAVPVPSLNMFALLEPGGCVMLYTGTTLVGKLHIAGVSAERASVSYLSAISSVNRINSPFPKCITPSARRSSLLSSTRLGDGFFDDRLHLLSPVFQGFESDPSLLISPSGPMTEALGLGSPEHSMLSDKESIKGLRDPVSSRFTLEYSNGSMFRFTMPELSTSALVKRCVDVLKCVLQKDISLLTIAKWYTIRNAPGTQNISAKYEWQLFVSALLGLFGYQLDSLPLMSFYLNSDCDTPGKNTKKMRSSEMGSNEDWSYVISSSYHSCSLPKFRMIGLNAVESTNPETLCTNYKSDIAFNTRSPLFQFMYTILFPLHLLYEDMKLSYVYSDSLPLLVGLLYQMAKDLRLTEYAAYYERDYPSECGLLSQNESQLKDCDIKDLDIPFYIQGTPCSLFEHIYGLIKGNKPVTPYPFIAGVNQQSRNIIEIVGVLMGVEREDILKNIVPPGSRSFVSSDYNPRLDAIAPSRAHEAVLLMTKLGMKRQDIINLPCGIGLTLASSIQTVTESPCQGWPVEAYHLISRLDLVPDSAEKLDRHPAGVFPTEKSVNLSQEGSSDRMSEAILRLRFNKDQRVEEVKRLLQSSEPVTIGIVQRPEVSDHEFIEEQERHLYAICTRTMALPVGRGMMDLHNTVTVVVTEQLDIPKLCLSGKVPPRGTTVEISHIEVVPNMNLWPLFHNGVAAGLKISPRSKNIDSTWILYNKPKNAVDSLPEHAGFLMALGLSGHLNNLMQLHLYNYLNKCHEMTSVGVLLGLAASKRGTMDVRATKIFSLHIESLLPPTSIELDLVQNIQVAALLGIGLVYQGTGHRHIAEALLSEIGRPPGPEMENSCDREGYSLAAGLGLGLVMLAKGSDPTGLADHDIADTLQYYMVGGHRRPLTGSQKEKYKSPSYQIREGDCVNNHVTGPGATLALGMMYFNTENIAVANWLAAPESEYMLDFVCPHQLLLRTLARGLVLWNKIIPSKDWIESHVPNTIRPYCLTRPRPGMDHVDLETMNQAYCNIVAGACMAMGLRFAGSANNDAFDSLFYYCRLFTSISSKSIAELAGKSTIETCICVSLLSLAMVMAGTGDLDALRLCRHLGSRVGQATNSVVTYGSHLAVHMALGLLYLGGGALSLSNSPESVAAMICAFFPRFPTHSNDNRYHLQAFRHLYVLAIEPRLFLPRDIDSGNLCYAHLHLTYRDTPNYKNQTVTTFAPCLLPHLDLLNEVVVEDDRYWPIVFSRGKNWDHLEKSLRSRGTIGIKLRAGCLPYVDDPKGYKTLLAQTLSTESAISWSISTDSILAFVSDKTTYNFTKFFLELMPHQASASKRELNLIQWLSNVSYECVTRNKLPLLDFWIVILGEVMKIGNNISPSLMWQLKLVLASEEFHIRPEHKMTIRQLINEKFDTWAKDHSDLLNSYINYKEMSTYVLEDLNILYSYLIFYGIPLRSQISSILSKYPKTIFEFLSLSKPLGLSPAVVRWIWTAYEGGQQNLPEVSYDVCGSMKTENDCATPIKSS